MSFDVKILLDSVAPSGCRVTTFVVRYPRFIHSEIMTHRLFSRNASSSRAIPTAKIISAVEEEPAMPAFWAKNQSGMQAVEELDNTHIRHTVEQSDVCDGTYPAHLTDRQYAEHLWLEARNAAVGYARKLHALGVHKQIVNRVIEPYSHISVLVTATDWANFFALRAHPDAQQEFQFLAYEMLDAFMKSTPLELQVGAWHLPFIRPEEHQLYTEQMLLKLCVARCARISFLNHEGLNEPLKDIDLHDRLKASGHMSPFEHACQAMGVPARAGNLKGWCQYRKLLADECIEAIDAEAVMARRPEWQKSVKK